MVFIGLGALLGVFWAGFLLEAHSVAALFIVGLCALVLGVTFAAIETHMHEGMRQQPGSVYDWNVLWVAVVKWGIAHNMMLGEQPLYVQTRNSVEPVTGVFFGRMNGAQSIFIDTVPDDPAHTFNTLKQGVM